MAYLLSGTETYYKAVFPGIWLRTLKPSWEFSWCLKSAEPHLGYRSAKTGSTIVMLGTSLSQLGCWDHLQYDNNTPIFFKWKAHTSANPLTFTSCAHTHTWIGQFAHCREQSPERNSRPSWIMVRIEVGRELQVTHRPTLKLRLLFWYPGLPV